MLLCALGLLVGQGAAANVQLTACSEGMCTVAASGGDEASVHAWSVSGRVAVSSALPCTSMSGGAVTVTLRVADRTHVATEASLWQRDGCAEDMFSPRWELAAVFTDGLSAAVGVDLQTAELQMSSHVGPSGWAGTLAGTVPAADLFAGHVSGPAPLALSATYTTTASGVVSAGAVTRGAVGAMLRGDDVTLTTDGVVFSGSMRTDGRRSFGDGALVVGGVPAVGSFHYDHVTEKFAMSGSAGTVTVGAGCPCVVELHNSAVVIGKEAGGAWEGWVMGQAQLFGGTPFGTLPFADGTLGPLSLTTTFVTTSGVLDGDLTFDHVKGDPCAQPTGTYAGTLSLAGAAALDFSGTMAFDRCSGVVSVEASVQAGVSGWVAPGAVSVEGTLALRVASSGFSHADGVLTALSVQTWAGAVSGSLASGGAGGAEVAFEVSFNTSLDHANVEAMLSYTDEHLVARVKVGSDCTGSGLVQVHLPAGLPSLEVHAVYRRAVCSAESHAWKLEGTLGQDMPVDFAGKTLVLAAPTVHVASDEEGAKTVAVVAALGPFSVTAEFGDNVPFTLTARAGGPDGAAVTPRAFLEALSAGGVFGANVGAAHEVLFSGLMDLSLSEVVVMFDFDTPAAALYARGTLFGADFSVLVLAEKRTGTWEYAAALTATGLQHLDLPGVLGGVVESLAPEAVSVSVATAALSFDGRSIRDGFCVGVTLPLDRGVMHDIAAVAPASLMAQAEAAGAGGVAGAPAGTVTVVAALTSSTEIRLLLVLAGGVELGSDEVVLREAALLLVLSHSAPAFGFEVVIDLHMDDRVLTAAAGLEVGASGLTLAASVDSNREWAAPFGIDGVAILFPLGLRLGVTPAGVLSEFALTGGVRLSSARGEVTLSVNLADLSETAFMVEVTNLDVQDVLEGLLNCHACTQGVGEVLTEMSVARFAASFNADPVNAATISFPGDVAVEIPAGVSIELTDLRLWGVVRVRRAYFALDAHGVEAAFEADTLRWGPLTITDAAGNRNKGPAFAFVLRDDEQSLMFDGRAEVFGQYVSLYLRVGDNFAEGHFELSLGSLRAEVEMTSLGRPGQIGFSNSVRAEFESDLLGDLARAATEFLLGVAAEMRSELDQALIDVNKAESKWDDAVADLEQAEKDMRKEINAASADVRAARKKVNSFDCGDIWGISDICEVGLDIARGTLTATISTLNAVRDASAAVLRGFAVLVDESRVLLDVAREVLSWAQAGVDVFADVVSEIGGTLEDMLIVHELIFTSDVSNRAVAVSFSLDATFFGERSQVGFSVGINFDELVDIITDYLVQLFIGTFPGAEDVVEAPRPDTVLPVVVVLDEAERVYSVAEYVAEIRTRSVHVASVSATGLAVVQEACDRVAFMCKIIMPSIVQPVMCSEAVLTASCNLAIASVNRDLWANEVLVSAAQTGVADRLAATARALEFSRISEQLCALLPRICIPPTTLTLGMCLPCPLLRPTPNPTLEAMVTTLLKEMVIVGITVEQKSAAKLAASMKYYQAKVRCAMIRCNVKTSTLSADLAALRKAEHELMLVTAEKNALDVPLFAALAKTSTVATRDVILRAAVQEVVTREYNTAVARNSNSRCPGWWCTYNAQMLAVTEKYYQQAAVYFTSTSTST